VDLHLQACGDWISFTVVTNLALSVSGVGIESGPDSPEDLYFSTFTLLHLVI